MIKEKYRKEVWSRNKPYMDSPCTTVDLEPCCERCKENKNPKLVTHFYRLIHYTIKELIDAINGE